MIHNKERSDKKFKYFSEVKNTKEVSSGEHISTSNGNNLTDTCLNNNTSGSDARVKKVSAVLDYIRNHYPISLWDLSKETNIPRSTIFYIIRDLEFSGVIYSKVQLKDNRSLRMIYACPIKEAENATN